MKWFKKRFFKRRKANNPPMPPYSEIVQSLYDKDLSFSDGLTPVRVLYSKDKAKRFIILKSDKGFFKYTYEKIYVYDEYEWHFICNEENACPACWLPYDYMYSYSFFGTEKDAMSALVAESDYKMYFL